MNHYFFRRIIRRPGFAVLAFRFPRPNAVQRQGLLARQILAPVLISPIPRHTLVSPRVPHGLHSQLVVLRHRPRHLIAMFLHVFLMLKR